MRIEDKEKFLVRFILISLNASVITDQAEGDGKLNYNKILELAKHVVNQPIDNLIKDLISIFQEIEILNLEEEDNEEIFTEHLKTDDEWFELICRLTEDVKDSISY